MHFTLIRYIIISFLVATAGFMLACLVALSSLEQVAVQLENSDIVATLELIRSRQFVVMSLGLTGLFGGLAGMAVMMLAPVRWKNVKQNFSRPQPWGTVMFASFLGAYFALIMWLAGYKLIDASLASVLNETNVTFIVLLAWLMLGEQINRRKLVGMGLTLGGVIIMMTV